MIDSLIGQISAALCGLGNISSVWQSCIRVFTQQTIAVVCQNPWWFPYEMIWIGFLNYVFTRLFRSLLYMCLWTSRCVLRTYVNDVEGYAPTILPSWRLQSIMVLYPFTVSVWLWLQHVRPTKVRKGCPPGVHQFINVVEGWERGDVCYSIERTAEDQSLKP